MLLALALALAPALPVHAQLVGNLPLPPLPGIGGAPLAGRRVEPVLPLVRREVLDPAEGALAAARDATTETLSDLRRLSVQRLLRRHPEAVEADSFGQPVVRGEVLAISPTDEALARAANAGFRVLRRSDLPALGLEAVVLSPPRGMPAREAAERLRALDPAGAYELNHLYQAGGEVRPGPAPGRTAQRASGPTAALGLLDGSVAAAAPALRRSKIVQRAFAPGGARVTDHATAVASLMVGDAGRFQGAAPGARLLVADVYGPTPAGGSAEAIARGLAWLAQGGVRVADISLVGPDNRLLSAAVAGFTRGGRIVVAAVGNDGPAAPPMYPAAYPGVVAVTGVDGRRRALPEAGRGPHVTFAAPGADMAAAGASGGYLTVRGTSFAAPLVAGALARRMAADPNAAVEALASEATDLGAPGRDPVYGRGLVAFELRSAPSDVGAHAP